MRTFPERVLFRWWTRSIPLLVSMLVLGLIFTWVASYPVVIVIRYIGILAFLTLFLSALLTFLLGDQDVLIRKPPTKGSR